MAIQNRETTLPGIWAENAQTDIPTPPVAGVTYRDTTLNSTAIDKAWPFKTIVDSSDFNQHTFLQDTLIKETEQYGIMRWNNTTSYKESGFCLGQDGKLYQALRDNQGKEPTASTDDWVIVPTDLSPYQLISNLSQTIDGSTSKYPSNKAVQDAIGAIDVNISIRDYLKTVYTVGSLFFSTASTCPLQTLGIGTWNKIGTTLTLSVNTNVPVKGNGKALGMTDGTVNYGGFYNGAIKALNLSANSTSKDVGTVEANFQEPNSNVILGLSTDPTKSGIVGTVTRTQITVNVFQRTA